MPPVSPVGSNHTCPAVTALVPHVGGPITTGFPGLLIGGIPSGIVGSTATCIGPADTVTTGAAMLSCGGVPAAFVGSATAHGGVVVVGNPLLQAV